MTDTSPCSKVGKSQSRSYACTGVLQTCTRPVVGKKVKDETSDHVTFFPLSTDQCLGGPVDLLRPGPQMSLNQHCCRRVTSGLLLYRKCSVDEGAFI
ncbi:hypothetical protein TNCV_5015501 [Trichonephila clavipes]|nr:hypothetical protein TNCV_5015501 [Trichonephila clavipes]